jgi:hypothetical protein
VACSLIAIRASKARRQFFRSHICCFLVASCVPTTFVIMRLHLRAEAQAEQKRVRELLAQTRELLKQMQAG